MDDAADNLSTKIARLVEERGWNQEDFARLADLNRLTIRGIFQGTPRRLHNATVAACARALGLAVHELRDLPLDALLPRMHVKPRDPLTLPSPPTGGEGRVRGDESSSPAGRTVNVSARLHELATQPELTAWARENPDRAAALTPEEWDELLSLQGTGGPLTEPGVLHFVDEVERRRRLVERVTTIAGTEYIDVLEQFVEFLHAKIQPYRDRS